MITNLKQLNSMNNLLNYKISGIVYFLIAKMVGLSRKYHKMIGRVPIQVHTVCKNNSQKKVIRKIWLAHHQHSE